MSDISGVIRGLLANGRANDLLEMMVGMSQFNLPSSSKEPMTDEEQKIWHMALLHLDFVSKYGFKVNSVTEGDKQYFSYPEQFEEWLRSGHPGIEEQEVLDYLRGRPL